MKLSLVDSVILKEASGPAFLPNSAAKMTRLGGS